MRSTLSAALVMVSQAVSSEANPIFQNSVVSNNLEFIRSSDQSVFACLTFEETRRAEMPDNRNNALFDSEAFIFVSQYMDGTSVDLWAHSDFGSQSDALQSVEPVAQAIGKLPTIMRSHLDHVVIHKGDETAFGEADGHFFVLYSDNIRTRINNHDLEETVFHESVHATLDKQYLSSRAWRDAVSSDGAYVTYYAASRPNKEDIAESALFAWAILVHPGRLPQGIEARVREVMPNRLAFFEGIFLGLPVFHRVGPEQGC